MKVGLSLGRAVIMFATVLALAVTTAGTGSSAPDVSHSKDTASAVTTAAACPQSGERVMAPGSSFIFLIDPGGFINWIPSEVEYFNLWDSYDGIVVYDNLFTECYEWADVFTFNDAHLAKAGTLPEVYIWDDAVVSGGAYRWIVSAEIFDKYGFSWSKIRTQDAVAPVAIDSPWDN
jgi:hypothetical protein